MEWKLFADAVIWLRDNWAKLRPWITPVALASGTKPVPKETFRIVLDTEIPPRWHMGKRGDEPATQIHASYYATNIAGENMLVVGCKLKPEGTDQTYDLRHFVKPMLDGGEKTPTALVTVTGFILPPITRDGEALEAQIIFVDQFGNEIYGPLTTFTQN